MNYKGYGAHVEFDDSVGTFHGRVLGTRDVITFEGSSVEELTRAFHDSVDDYLEWCAELGQAPEKPYSGRFVLRLNPDLHRELDAAATRRGRSLNAFVADLLRREITGSRADK